MKSAVRVAGVVAALIVAVTLAAAPAQAEPPGPGGGGADTKGYQLRTPTHICLIDGVFVMGLTLSCNYNAPQQHFTADRSGAYGYISTARGGCLRPRRGSTQLISGTCDSGALWRRTTNSQWVFKATGQCMQGSYDNGRSAVFLATCADSYTQRWYATPSS